jgi:competence protein ComEC
MASAPQGSRASLRSTLSPWAALLEWIRNRQSSIVNRQSSRPAAAVALTFSVGIALSTTCHAYAFGGLAAGAALLTAASFLALRRNRIPLALALGLAVIALSGLLLALAHRDSYADNDLRHLIPRRLFSLQDPVYFEGCVLEESRRRGEDNSTTIALQAFQKEGLWGACKGKAILRIAIPDGTDAALQPMELARGDRIRGWAVWQTPRNYENPGSADRVGQLARRGIYLLGRTKSQRLLERIPGGCSNPWSDIAGFVNTRVRSRLASISEKPGGQSGAILASLLIGDYSGLNNKTREIFQNSGTYHVLVVSGMHVAWISGLLLQLFKYILLPERMRYLLVALVILLYTCVVGFEASITRCLWMFFLYLIARMLFRRADPVNILFVSALVLLAARPVWLFEPGFQLSFLSVMAIAMTALPGFQRYLKPLLEPIMNSGNADRLFLQPGRWHRYGRRLRTQIEILIEGMTDTSPPVVSRILFWTCRALGNAGLATGGVILISICVQIWIEPLLALHFNRMSWISPLANLILVPLSSAVLAAGIFAVLATGLPYIGPLCLPLAAWGASFLRDAAAFIADIPGAWQRCPPPSTAWVLAGVLLLFAWCFFERRCFWIPVVCIAALLLCLSRGSVPVLGGLLQKWRHTCAAPNDKGLPGNTPVLSLTFLDVGEGDSIVIRFPNGQVWVLDAGGSRLPPSHPESDYAFDVGEAVVSRYLWHEWIQRIDRLLLSHPDQDHAGGMPAVLNNFKISSLNYSPAGASPILDSVTKTAHERKVTTKMIEAGIEERIGSVLVCVLHPERDFKSSSSNENSIVLHISFGRFSALLTGDLEKSGEKRLVSQSINLHSLLLKVAHHGSRFGTTDALLGRVQPQWAVVSVGRNNPFGHPSRETMERIRRHGARSFLTMNAGAVRFETDGRRYVIRSHKWGVLERGILE